MCDDAMSANLLDPAISDEAVKRAADDLTESAAVDFRPAVLARYKELAWLRYDYPLVLDQGAGSGEVVRSLSGIVDGLLRQIVPEGIEGERVRKHVLGLEREIRALAAAGTKGSLSQLWERAHSNLLARTGGAGRAALEDSLTRARSALAIDGEVIDCDVETPAQLLNHVWSVVEGDKARQFCSRVDRIILGLSDILKVDFMKSDNGRKPERLKHSVGSAYENAFDFEKMSQLLGASSRKDALPKKRRQRIEAVLAVLKSQRFFTTVRKHSPLSRSGCRKWSSLSKPSLSPSSSSRTATGSPRTSLFLTASIRTCCDQRMWPCFHHIWFVGVTADWMPASEHG
jgi:hypothetical protein